VVLGEGQLTEYDKWTDAMQVHGAPINLRYATARISKQAGERRFVFEVLTPELRRVYQAASEQECKDWVEAIQRSVEALLNGWDGPSH
jgi:Arf-GAP/SH3 domain/ANK repeat/PH domain-containing protein